MTDETLLERMKRLKARIEQIESDIHNLQTGNVRIDGMGTGWTKEEAIRRNEEELQEAHEELDELLRQYPHLTRL